MHAYIYLDEAVVEEHSDESCADARVLLHGLRHDAPHDGFGVGARVAVEANGQAGAARGRRRRRGRGRAGVVTVAVSMAGSHDRTQQRSK